MIQPRDYQNEALKKVMSAYRAGITRQLISLPTGSGKTIILGLVAKELRTRTLLLAHREELLSQAMEKMELIYPEADIGLFQGRETGGLNAEICIASIQTATRHVEELKERGYKLLICDEAHHAVSDSYMRVFNELGFMHREPDKLLLGVTATPYRSDGIGLNTVFDKIVLEYSIMTMMRMGYLCDVRGLRVFTGEDISNVHMHAGDFAVNELSAKIDIPERNALIADTYVKHGEGRHGVVFGVKVTHAMHIAEEFRKRGVSCEVVYGEMPSDKRQEVLRRYQNREIQVLSNVGVLTEGWDVPDTDIIMMARPTKSRGLYVQCAGRGLRKIPGKTDCLLVDFVDNAQKHDLCEAGTLQGKKRFDFIDGESFLEALERQAREQKEAKPGVYQSPQFEEFDVFERSKYNWKQQDENYRLSLMSNGTLWCKWSNGKYIPVYVPEIGATKELCDTTIPLGYAMGVCEDFIRQFGGAKYALKNAQWRNQPASEKQISALKKMNISYDENISKGEVCDLFDAMNSEKATSGQIRFIKTYKLHEQPELLTKRKASCLIRDFKDGRKVL